MPFQGGSGCDKLLFMDDEVVELDVPWQPDSVGAEPILYQDEGRATLTYYTSSLGPNGPVTVLTFSPCMVTKFGYPNEDGRFGHPVWNLDGGLYEVTNSSWLRALQAQNAVGHPEAELWWPNSPYAKDDRPVRHFVAAFKESTFECLAQSMSGRIAGSESRLRPPP